MNEQFINDLSKELAKLGTIHSVGEEWISYTGKIPSGGIPYCGQEVTRETYSALWSWVQAQGLVKTESEWQSIASSQNGNVPFYSSGNGTTTFRVPKLIGYVKGASSQAESGDYIKEGLPNVVGGLASIPYTSAETSGAFRLSNGIVYAVVQGGTDAAFTTATADFDASRSNPIYGRSLSVTPETSCVLFGVYAFGTVSNPNDLNVSNLAADVNSIKTNYLPLSGGTMTGAIKFTGSESIYRTDDNTGLSIYGGTGANNGAYLQAFGKNMSGNQGIFNLVASDGPNKVALRGEPDGNLLWGGKSVSAMGMPSSNRYNLSIGASDSTYTAPDDGWFYFWGGATSGTAVMTAINVGQGLQTTGFTHSGISNANIFIPVRKGDVIKLYYTANTDLGGRFYYAEGRNF